MLTVDMSEVGQQCVLNAEMPVIDVSTVTKTFLPVAEMVSWRK